MIDKLREVRLWLEVALALGVLVFGAMWWQKFTEPAPVGVPVEASPSPLVEKIPTEKLECVPVIVYRDKAKDKLNLPPSVRADKDKAVISATEIKPDIRSHTITTVLDTETGETVTYDTRNKLPIVAIDVRGEAGITYGLRGSEQVVRLEARQALFDIKAIKVGAVASYDIPMSGVAGSSYIGVGAWLSW